MSICHDDPRDLVFDGDGITSTKHHCTNAVITDELFHSEYGKHRGSINKLAAEFLA